MSTRNKAMYATLAFAASAALLAAQQNSPVVGARLGEEAETPQHRIALPNAAGPIAVPEGFDKLRLTSGYLLQMDIYNVPEMATELRVDEKGFVTVPLIGAVHVTGDTLPQAQKAIADELVAKEILKDPQVTLNVLQFAPTNISVLGEVQSPGRVQLLAPEPLGDVLALAGGETIAAGKDIEIQHTAADGKQTSQHVEYVRGGDTAVLRNTEIEPGDTVLVHRAGIVYVLGAVSRPGGYLMVNGGSLSVVQAVALAGGTTLQASAKWAVVVRRKGDSYIQFKVPLSKMETGGATPVQLEWNDALYVPVSTWKAVLVNGSNVISAATAAAIYRSQ
ncbi:MAG TPA: polysaccharide biosynthesis/export family protein [Terracidiphilus sp.]|nr:polysaccharide biosynthesis/export family protein [Terracidiphilus sp.]